MKAIVLLCCVWLFSNWESVSTLIISSKKEKCYDPYGCFPTSYPYSHNRWTKGMAPWSPGKLQVKLILSTRYRKDMIITNMLPESMYTSNLKLDKPIKMIAPGFLHGAGNLLWTNKIRNALLSREDCNVMVISWKEPLLRRLQYSQAMTNTRMLGAVVGEFISQLRTFHNYSLDMVHIYGHSLGAHVAGYIGKYCNNKFKNIIIGSITGLDPAGPGFEGKPEQARLDFKDAKFVLALHTDAGTLSEGHLGIVQNVGYVDIFPNGGEEQPGCPGTITHKIKPNDKYWKPEFIEWYNQAFGCHHIRATDYAIEWLENTDCLWIAHWCNSWQNYLKGMCRRHGQNNSLTVKLGSDYMYYEESKPKAGKYYIETNSHKPFCIPEPHEFRRLHRNDGQNKR